MQLRSALLFGICAVALAKRDNRGEGKRPGDKSDGKRDHAEKAKKMQAFLSKQCNGRDNNVDSCTCKDGATISFPAEKLCGRDNKPEICTCSDGSQLKLDEILSERRDHAEKAEKMQALLSKKCEGDDNNVDSCTCKDGATISFPAEKLCGRDNKPETCTCSDGSQLNLAEILSERRDHAEKAEKMRALLSKKCEGDDNNVDSCTCKDGATISFPAEKLCGRDNKPETCTCSDGSQLNLAEILSERRDHAEKAQKMQAFLSKKCEGDDNNVNSCTCKDGANISFPVEKLCGRDNKPETCTCSDGSKLNLAEILNERPNRPGKKEKPGKESGEKDSEKAPVASNDKKNDSIKKCEDGSKPRCFGKKKKRCRCKGERPSRGKGKKKKKRGKKRRKTARRG